MKTPLVVARVVDGFALAELPAAVGGGIPELTDSEYRSDRSDRGRRERHVRGEQEELKSRQEYVLRSNDHQVSVLACRHPFSDPFLGLLVLIVVLYPALLVVLASRRNNREEGKENKTHSSVDEVAASISECIEQFE